MNLPLLNNRIPLPDLDDRTYHELVDEAVVHVPALLPEWTDHNPSDPGIILTELLAWLTEMILYRVNDIPEDNYRTFLKLLNGEEKWQDQPLEQAIQLTLHDLREPYRAVTTSDFETLATTTWLQLQPETIKTAIGRLRAYCIPRCNLESRDIAAYDKDAPGHVSLVVVSGPEDGSNVYSLPHELRENLWTFLDQRRLLGTNHHVVNTRYMMFDVQITLVLREDNLLKLMRNTVRDTLTRFYHPIVGGNDQTGWSFGRAVYVSELYTVLENIPGVDYVKHLQLIPRDSSRFMRREDKSLIGLHVNRHELVEIMNIAVTQVKE